MYHYFDFSFIILHSIIVLKKGVSIMNTIMLSIRASEAQKIVTGRKNYEYRTRRPKDDIEWLVLYENAPVSAVRYILHISAIQTPEQVPCDGIDQNDAFHHNQLRYRYAYQIQDVYECCEKIDKEILKNNFSITPPRSFLYLNSNVDFCNFLKAQDFRKIYHYHHIDQ